MGQAQSTPAFCIVVGSSAFSAQSDYLQANQYLTLFCQGGIPSNHIRAIIPTGPYTLSNPSPGFNEPQLQIPTPYLNDPQCIIHPTQLFSAEIQRAFRDFMRDSSVSCVVFIFLNHGSRDGLGLPQQSLGPPQNTILVDGFIPFCDIMKKPLLAILDCCQSTPFAMNVIQELKRQQLSRDIVFLTTGWDFCFTSAVIVSQDPTLVYERPILTPSISYRIRHSMFSRVILHDLAYRIGATDPISILEWPTRLNDQNVPKKNGFQAIVQYSSINMAKRTIRSFFPFGPFHKKMPLSWNDKILFGQVILNREIGDLPDDICQFYANAGDENLYSYRYIEVFRGVNGKIEVRARGTLDANHALYRAIREDVDKNRGLPETENPESDMNHIGLGWIADFAVPMMKSQSLPVNHDPIEDQEDIWYNKLKSIVTELNGIVQIQETTAFCRLYSASLLIKDETMCRTILMEARNRAVILLADKPPVDAE
jgi:hypothetical protein